MYFERVYVVGIRIGGNWILTRQAAGNNEFNRPTSEFRLSLSTGPVLNLPYKATPCFRR